MRGAGTFAVLASVALLLAAGRATAQAPATGAAPTPADLATAPPQYDLDAVSPIPTLSLTGEFLFLRPHRDGLGFAVVSSTSNGSTFSTLESLSWDGTPGLRVGARYRLDESGVELGTTFTYFHARTRRTVTAPAGGTLEGVLATDRQARDAAAADGDAGLGYAVLDFDAGKSAYLNESLWVQAFGGVRLASINQTLTSIDTGGALGDLADYVNSPIRFSGAGLTAGGEAVWGLYHGWGLYGRGRLGLVSGVFDSQRTETVGPTVIDSASERYFAVIPVAEIGAGLSYQGERWSVRAGYELTDWLNMVSGIGGPNGGLTSRRRGDLTLEALALRLGYAF